MSDAPSPASPPEHKQPAAAKSLVPATVEGWLMLLAGLGCLGYAAYSIVRTFVDKSHFSVVAMILLTIGGMIIPIRVVGLVAGFALVGLGIYMLIDNYSTGQSLLIAVLGVITIAERWRRV